MRKKGMRIVALFTAIALLSVTGISATGCATKVSAKDLLKDVTAANVSYELSEETFQKQELAAADFAFALLKQNYENSNTLVSPLSAEIAMAMTANGAGGNTLSQMVTTLAGEDGSLDDLNAFLKKYTENLANDSRVKFTNANSIWLNKDYGYTLREPFLANVKAFYNASVYNESFNGETLADLNHWVSNNTDKMIPSILDDLDSSMVMLLVNAICFEAKWEEPYEERQIIKDYDFYAADGTSSKVTMLSSTEKIHISCDKGYGMLKPYEKGYYFVALLPNEGVSVEELLESLDGVSWTKMMQRADYGSFGVMIPEFSFDGDYSLKTALVQMGMTDAFDSRANFETMTNEKAPLYIEDVIQKTHIEVDRNGTKAAAASAVIMAEKCEAPGKMLKDVILDRPFVYAIVDTNRVAPVFIGTIDSLD